MPTKIFVNLPVKNLDKSKRFFTKLGYKFNSQFTDEKAACLVISEDIYAMLVTEEFFQTFINRKITDTTKTNEVLIALSAESREEVDEIAEKAVKAGGKIHREPEDHEWMYGQSFEDIDGHIWEIIYMDESNIEKME